MLFGLTVAVATLQVSLPYGSLIEERSSSKCLPMSAVPPLLMLRCREEASSGPLFKPCILKIISRQLLLEGQWLRYDL